MALRPSRSIAFAVALAMTTSPFFATAQSAKDTVAAPRLAQPTQAPAATSAASSKPVPMLSGAPSAIQDDASKRTNKAAISQSGPAVVKDQTKRATTTPSPTGNGQVTDRAGQPLSGAVEVGPNQILDPRTGTIHKTVPTANGAQVID